MKRAAEIGAQVFTARDALLRDNLEDLRVAFLLFDSALETLMVRKIGELSRYLLAAERPWWVEEKEQVPANLSDPAQISVEKAKRAGDELIHWSFSKTQVRKVHNDFREKLRFLAWHGDIPEEYVGVVARLHEYRNEMYHREESRPEALRIVTHLYASVVAEFLELLTPQSFGWGSDSDNMMSRLYARMGQPRPKSGGGLGLHRNLQQEMATNLRVDLDLGDVPDLISVYISIRVETVHEYLGFSGEVAASVWGGSYSEMDMVRMACQRSPLDSPAPRAPTRGSLARWDEWSARTRSLPDALTAFRSLAEFEAEFEEFEQAVVNLMMHAEAEVDRQIDEERERRLERE